MLKNVKDIYGYKISAFNGNAGMVYDLLFDEQTRNVRFVVVNTSSSLSPSLVLIEPSLTGKLDMGKRELPVFLTVEEIQNSPSIETHSPSVRQNEGYAWPYYWVGTGGGFPGVTPSASYGLSPFGLTPTLGTLKLSAKQQESNIEPHLRSSRDLIGYGIRGTDRNAGYIESFLLEDESWNISYMIARTGSRMLGARKVLVAMRWLIDIDPHKEKAMLDLKANELKLFPEYDNLKIVVKKGRETLHTHLYKMVPRLILDSRK